MARKSKSSRKQADPGPRELDPNDAKLGQLSSYEDVADSEDEFYLNQDRIAFDEDPITRRRRLNRDALDDSDEEVLDLEDLPSSENEDGESDEEEEVNDTINGEVVSSDEEEDREDKDEDEDEYRDWGKSRKAYYDANDIENEEDAAMEEAEARRIQRRQLASISAKDFGVNEEDWKQSTADNEILPEDDDYAAPLAKKIQIPSSKEDKLELLHLLHPEFEHLKNEYTRLSPLHKEIVAKGLTSKNLESTARRKAAILTAYLGVLSMYFAIMSHPRPEGQMVEIRDHSIMEALVKWRTTWLDVEGLPDEPTTSPELISDVVNMEMDEEPVVNKPVTNGIMTQKSSTGPLVNGRKEKPKKLKSTSLSTKEARKIAKSDARLKDLDDLLLSSTVRQKPSKAKALVQFKNDDFGDEDFIFEEDAEEKAKRKKSLRFYTAQIHQKSNKRDRAGRDAGGDLDVPHRERNKDRQERLNAGAEKRGTGNGIGADLDDIDDYEDNDLTSAKTLKGQIEADGMEDALAYYNQVAAKAKTDKLKKQVLHEASKTGEQILEVETIDPVTGKRAIGYTIEKNKGLTPHRKKDVRNPRVKKRKKYEVAKKKLGSKKAIYKPPTSAYSGEATGIRTKVIKSVRFS